MDIRRKIDGTLSKGRGEQLLWVSVIIAICFFFFWGLANILFEDDSFKWQDIIALFLDPGVFGGSGSHDGFRLVITFFGVFLLAAVLISIVSNIFDNISESYKKGEKRYRFNNHLLILGSNDQLLIGILQKILNDKTNQQIVIMTSKSVEKVRAEVEANPDVKKLLKRITFYYDCFYVRQNLLDADCLKASDIYIIGEGNKQNDDISIVKCMTQLSNLFNEPDGRVVSCYAFFSSQATLKEYKFDDYPERLNVKIIDINLWTAQHVLKNSKLLKSDTRLSPCGEDINIIIIGLSEIGKDIATTIAHTFHFKEKRRTIISIIDSNKKQIYDFVALYRELFSHTDKTFFQEDDEITTKSALETDIIWNLIASHPTSPNVIEFIEKLQGEKEVHVYICNDDFSQNLFTEFNLYNQKGQIKVNVICSETWHLKTNTAGDISRFDITSNLGFITDAMSVLNNCNERNVLSQRRYLLEYFLNYLDAENVLLDRINVAKYADFILNGYTLPPERIFVIRLDRHGACFGQYVEGYILSEWQRQLKSLKLLLKQAEEPSLLSSFLGETSGYPAIWIPADFMRILFEHVKHTKNLSKQSIEALYEIIDNLTLEDVSSEAPTMETNENYYEWVHNNLSEESKRIKGLARDIIEYLSIEIGDPYACYFFALLLKDEGDREQSQSFYIRSTKFIAEQNNFEIPDLYFRKVGNDYVEDTFKITQEDYYLDYLVAWEVSKNIVMLLDLFPLTEDYVKALCPPQTEEALFLRLGSLKRLDSSLSRVWLTKAVKFAKNNNNLEVLRRAFLRLGDIDEIGRYYERAYRIDKTDQEVKRKYARALYWGMGIEQDKDKATKLGYDPKIETTEFRDLIEELEVFPIIDYDIDNDDNELSASVSDESDFYETFGKEIQTAILSWREQYPHIPHPFDKLVDEFLPNSLKSGHEFEIKEIMSAEEKKDN